MVDREQLVAEMTVESLNEMRNRVVLACMEEWDKIGEGFYPFFMAVQFQQKWLELASRN